MSKIRSHIAAGVIQGQDKPLFRDFIVTSCVSHYKELLSDAYLITIYSETITNYKPSKS